MRWHFLPREDDDTLDNLMYFGDEVRKFCIIE